MVMSDDQFDAASALYTSLRAYANARGLVWSVCSMLPIHYTDAASSEPHQLSPDLFVAFVPPRRRRSYYVDREGKPPAFVLEILSPESMTRDLRTKSLAYDYMGVQEYVLFEPSPTAKAPIRAFHRIGERFSPWEPDEQGRLHSEMLDLYLFVEDGRYGPLLRAETPDGERLLTLEEAEAAYEQAEAAREQAEAEVA